jgi:hypothetical protein
MRGKLIKLNPQRIADAKRLYEQTTTPADEIAVMLGISRRTLDRRIHRWNWLHRTAPRNVVARALSISPGEHETGTPGAAVDRRAANAARIQEIVSQALDGVERVLRKAGSANEGGAESNARTLAAVARSLQAMAPLTHAHEMTPNEADDDPVPLDIDEFRYELARRIRGIIEARRERASRNDGGIVVRIEPPTV